MIAKQSAPETDNLQHSKRTGIHNHIVQEQYKNMNFKLAQYNLNEIV